MLQQEIVNHALQTCLSLNELFVQSLPYCVQDSGSKYHVQITSKREYTTPTVNIKLRKQCCQITCSGAPLLTLCILPS